MSAEVTGTPSDGRTEGPVVYVSTEWVPDAATAKRRIAAAGDAVSCFLSVSGDTVLTVGRYPDDSAPRTAVRYELQRSVVFRDDVTPGAVVIATFDVDGPEAQARIVAAICDALEAAPRAQHPGLLSANFHVSTDGSRVLNYAEWTDDADHEAFLAGATRATAQRVTGQTPGVRPIGFVRYHPR